MVTAVMIEPMHGTETGRRIEARRESPAKSPYRVSEHFLSLERLARIRQAIHAREGDPFAQVAWNLEVMRLARESHVAMPNTNEKS